METNYKCPICQSCEFIKDENFYSGLFVKCKKCNYPINDIILKTEPIVITVNHCILENCHHVINIARDFYSYIRHSINYSSLKIKIIMTETNNEVATEQKLTFGQKAVGVSFNPSQDPEVSKLKQNVADTIDQMHSLRTKTESPEVKRLASVAITELQSGQMWAVKALTWKD